MRWLLGFATVCTATLLFTACGDSSNSLVGERGEDGINGVDGEDGTSCYAKPIDNGYKIMCGEDSVGVFTNGTNGANGDNCSVKANDNGYTVLCGEDSVGVLTNGQKGDTGEGCSVTAVPRGYKIYCGADSVEVISDDIKERGNITLRIVDYNSGLPIVGAQVISAVSNDTLYTDTLGVLTVKDNVLGEYTFLASKKGYAPQVKRVTLSENGTGDISRVPDAFADVKLRQQGVTVNGTVLVANGLTGLVSGASKVKVILQFSDKDLYPSEVTTMTDSLGVYTFSNLPESVGYTVYVPQTVIKGASYASTTSSYISNLRVGERKDMDVVNLSIVGLTPELVSHNLDGIDVKDTVVFTFSTELIKDSIIGNWSVVKGGYINGNSCYSGTSVLTNTQTTPSGNTLKIAPTLGTWTKYDLYCISGTGYTYEGQQINVAKTFIPGNVYDNLTSISNLSSNHYYDSYVQLKWMPTGEDITGYKVYYKTNKVNDFREYTNWNSGRVQIDSSTCERKNNYYLCDQYNDYATTYNRIENNYYWYTEFEIDSSTNYEDRDYYGYDDSTSITFLWNLYDTIPATTSTYTFRSTKYYWRTGRDTLTCSVSYTDSYTNCPEYTQAGTSPSRSVTVGTSTLDEEYYTYYWYRSFATPEDTCEIFSGSYTSCPQYLEYGTTYYDYVYGYYTRVASGTETCVQPSGSTSSYTNCDYYKDNRVSYSTYSFMYYKKTPIDSIGCTVRSGDYIYDNFECDYNRGLYGSYNSTDYNYIWYTKYANIQPTATDSMAFVSTYSVFANDGITSASFIVLPYANRNGEIVTSSVAEADSTKILRK